MVTTIGEGSQDRRCFARLRGRVGLGAVGLGGIALLGLHAIRAAQLFPSPGALWDDRPPITVDHAIHLYHGYLGAKFLRESGESWGYDPHFMAGYPKTPVYDSSSGPAELVQYLAGGYSPRAYKLLMLGIAFLTPVAVIAAAAIARPCRVPEGDGAARLNQPVAGGGLSLLLTALFTVWYWWIGFPDVLVRTGLIAFLWASGLGTLLLALLLRHGERPQWTSGLVIALVASLAWQAHATFAIQILVPLVVWYAMQARRHGWRWHAGLWAAAAGALVATSWWWRPLVRFLPLKTGSDLFMTADGPYLLTYYFRVAEARLPLFILLCGVVGLVAWVREGRYGVAGVFGSHVAALSLLTFWGSLWTPTRHMEPLRFQVPLTLSWCLPAGRGAAMVLRALTTGAAGLVWPARLRTELRPTATRGQAALHGSAAALYLAVLWLVTMPLLAQVTARQARTRRPLTVGLKPEMIALVDWLRTHTDTSARILFEDQLRLWEVQDSETLHWTPLLPLLTGRQFVGGLYHMAFIPHQDAAFGDWKLSGRHIRHWSSRELAEFCERYNIGWIVTWSRASPRKESGQALSTEVFASLPGCRSVATLPRHSSRPDEDRYTIFELDRPHDYLANGRGRVAHVDYNRIELADLEPEGGRVDLRFHWLSDFVSDPPVHLERLAISGDRVGFVRIRSDRPIPRLVIRNGYRER
jgi:hypothetical protein